MADARAAASSARVECNFFHGRDGTGPDKGPQTAPEERDQEEQSKSGALLISIEAN